MNIPVQHGLYIRLQKFNDETGMPFTELFRRSVLNALDVYDATGSIPARITAEG